jgi:hypothetical protein
MGLTLGRFVTRTCLQQEQVSSVCTVFCTRYASTRCSAHYELVLAAHDELVLAQYA